MKRKTGKTKEAVRKANEDLERLMKEKYKWLAEFRSVLSPYWSSRMEYQPAGKIGEGALQRAFER